MAEQNIILTGFRCTGKSSVGRLLALEMERELSGILGRKVDMRTAKDLSRYFRDEVVRTAVVQYAA